MICQKPLKLLVSVRDEFEAVDALAGGADWIDLKEPFVGPLAAMTANTAECAVRVIAGRRPVSAALGELLDWPASEAQNLLQVAGIEVVKLGLRGCLPIVGWQNRWRQAFEQVLVHGKHLAAVIYADWQAARSPRSTEILELAIENGCQYLLVDTYEKRGENVFDVLSSEELAHIIHVAGTAKMETLLAGNLRIHDLPRIAGWPVGVVAVRGAVCPTDRTGRLERRLVEEFKQHLGGEVLVPEPIGRFGTPEFA